MKSIESMARGSCETYKEAELSFIDTEKELKEVIKAKEVTKISKHIKAKEDAEQRLLKLGRQILLEKDKYQRVVFQIKKNIHTKSKKIGVFAKDMALKNFIFQVNNLKNREYDLNQVIADFNSNWELQQKKRESMKTSEDLSTLEGPIQHNIISRQYKSLPLQLDIPELEFFSFLENEFYKSIHHDLLNKKHAVEGNHSQVISYKSFGRECVSLSKLLDEIKLTRQEKACLANLPQKDRQGYFIDKFLESFIRYKKSNFVLHSVPTGFFIENIIQPLFAELASKRKFQRIFNILSKVQTIIVRDVQVIDKISQSMVLTPGPKDPLGKTSQQARSVDEKEKKVHFRKWLDSRDERMLTESLGSKLFWFHAFTQIFSTCSKSVSTDDSSLLEKSLISGNSMKKFHTDSDVGKNLSFFERIKKGGQKLMSLHGEKPKGNVSELKESVSIEAESPGMRSFSKDSVSEISQELVTELVIRNLLSCKPFVKSNEDFLEIVDFLDEKLAGLEVRSMWESLDIATYYETEVAKLTLICFRKRDLKSLRLSRLLKQISIFDN